MNPVLRPSRRASDVAFRESVDQRLALVALAEKKASDARRRAEEEHEVVRLLNGRHDADSDDDGLSLSSADSVSSDAPSAVSWNNASSRVWRAEEMRPQQLKAVKMIAENEECKGKVLLVDRTGGGFGILGFE